MVTYPLKSPFGDDIAFAYVKANSDQPIALSPEEQKCLSPKASQKRREQFALGRKAAREAMGNLGIAKPGPVLRDSSRQPIWPGGLIGSISHTDQVAVAAVTYPSRFESVGIDLHSLGDPRLIEHSENLLARICHESETSWINSQPQLRTQRTALVFSAKESIFKALYPLYQASIAFKDVELYWRDNGFEATLLFDASKSLRRASMLEVKCQIDAAFVLTGVEVKSA